MEITFSFLIEVGGNVRDVRAEFLLDDHVQRFNDFHKRCFQLLVFLVGHHFVVLVFSDVVVLPAVLAVVGRVVLVVFVVGFHREVCDKQKVEKLIENKAEKK